jgi:hypothetical protein
MHLHDLANQHNANASREPEAAMTIKELKSGLQRAEARLDEARSDGEWTAANEMVIYWRMLVDDAQQRRAA